MEKNLFFVIFCNLLFIPSAACKDSNRNQPNRLKRDFRLSPIHATSMESDQFEHGSELNGHEQNNRNSDNDNSNDHPNDDSKIRGENVNTTHLRNNSSFISLKNYKIARKPSRYSYLDKDNTYAVNTKNNDKKNIQKEINTIPNTFIQQAQSNTHGAVINIDYVTVFNDDFRLISLLHPYNPEIYAFREMKHYSEHNDELKREVKKVIDVEIHRIEKLIANSMNKCSYLTKELNTLVYHLENPENHEIRESEYAAKKQNYKDKLNSLYTCIKTNYNSNKKEIQTSKRRIYHTVDQVSCYWFNICPTDIYYNMVSTVRSILKRFNDRYFASFINKTTEIQISGVDTIKKIKGQLNKSLSSETTEFILEEVEFVVEDMNVHLRKVITSIEASYKLSKQSVWSNFQRYTLQNELFFLAYVHSTFKISSGFLKKLENVTVSKLDKLYHSFTKFEDGLNNIINTLMSSTYYISSINSILSDSQEIIKSVETLRSSSSEQIKEHILYSNPQIKEIKKNLDEEILKLEGYLKYAKGLNKEVNETFKLNIAASNEIEKKRNETTKNMSSLEKCKILLDIIDKMKSNKYKITKNSVKINEYLTRINTTKRNYELSEKIINEYVQKIKELLENEKQFHSTKEEIKKHLKYFPETLDNIKMISHRDKIEKYILSIENLIKDAPYVADEFTTEKRNCKTKQNQSLIHFIKKFTNICRQFSRILYRTSSLTQGRNTKEETEKLYEKTKEKYQQLVDMNCNDLPEMLNNLNDVVNSLSQLKNKIIQENTQNINKNMSSSLDNLTEETNRLKNSLKDYEQNADKLKTYINSINEMKDKIRTNLIEKNEDIPEGKTIYEEYTKNKGDVTNKENTLTHDIDVLKESIRKANEQIETYKNVMQKLETHNGEEYQETKTSLEDFKTKIEKLELEKLQDEFRGHKESVSSTINQIENTKKIIDTLKSLNILTRNSKTNTQSILKIKESKNNLVKKIDNHIQTLNSYNIVEEKERSSLLKTLNEEKNNVESKIPDASISKLEEDEKALQDYCENEKSNIDKLMVTNSGVLETHKTQCHNRELEINKFNANYQVLEKKIEELVKDQHSQIIILVDKLITTRDTEINEKIELNLNSLKGMKTKLDAFNFDEDVKNDINDAVQSKISAFKENVKNTLQNIDNEIGKINGIKQKYNAYMEGFNKEKDKNTEFKDKKENMEKIYEQMKESTLNEIDQVEKEISILNQVKKIEMEHTRILIHHVVHMIDEESKKAKSVMEDIKSSKSKIDEIKVETEEFKQKNMNNFEYAKYYNMATQSNTKINELYENATRDKETADKSEDIKVIELIQKNINGNLQQIKEQYNSMEEIRKQINNMKGLLALSNSNTIATEIINNTKDALRFKQEAENELKKSKELLKDVEAQVAKVQEHKGKIVITLEDEQINAQVNAIELIKHGIVNKKKEMESYLDKIKEYKDKCTTEISNSNRGKNKIEFLKKVNHSMRSSSNNVNMDQINENIEKTQQYLKDVEDLERQATDIVNLFMKHEETINNTFQQSEILGIETKSKKKFNKATEIMKEIEKQNSEIQTKVNDFQEKLNKLKEPDNTDDAEDELNNETSAKAKVLIQTNLERVQYNLSQVADIKQEGDNIFNRATGTMNSVTDPSQNKDTKTLDTVKSDESKYIQCLSQITADKNLIVAEMNKLNGISSNIVSIEKELNESRKNYEIGLLQKIDEVGKSRKTNIDLKNESINSTISYFSSLFSGLDLNQYDFKKNIDDYQKKMKEIHGKFGESMNKIAENLKKASEESANYTLANQLRREAQQEKAKLINSEEEASKYIEEIKKVESIRFINHMKENLNEISTSIEKEKLRINEGCEYIKQLVEGIKNAGDERDVAEKLKQVEGKNAEVQTRMHSTYKNLAKEMLEHITTSANFMNIKIIPELSLTEAHVNEAVELKFQPDGKVTLETGNISKSANELDVQKNIQEAYHLALEINKCANEIEAQQTQNKLLLLTVNVLDYKINFINELKDKVKIAKNNENAVSGKIVSISSKIAELDKLSCSGKSYDNLFRKNEANRIKKNIRDSFNQVKRNAGIDLNLKNINEAFVTSQTSLKNVEQVVETLKANEINAENLQDKSAQIEAVHNKIVSIEQNIASLNTSLDNLLNKGRKCEIDMYTSLRDSVKSKISADEEIIDNMQKYTSQYLAYVENNYNATLKDILTLNEHFGNKMVTDHAATNFEKSNKSSEALSTTVDQARVTINNIKNALIEVNEETEFTSLENSAKEIEKLYNILNDKKNAVNEIYKTSTLVKSKEMKSNAAKYNDMAKIFNNVLDAQKSRITNNKSNVTRIKDTINTQLYNLEATDSTFTLESINAFHELSDNIKTNIDELEKLEQTNRQEHNNVKTHKERIEHLINRRDSLKNAAKEYEEDANLKKLRGEIPNQVINDIRTANEELKNSDELYNKLMNNVEENNELCKNNYTENYVSQVLQKIEDLKKRFTQNLPEREKVLQIESNFNDIKSIFGEIKTFNNVEEFVTNMYKQIDGEKESVKNQTDIEKIKLTIQNITNKNEEVKTYLSKFTNALERINVMKKEIDELFSLLLPTNNTNENENAKRYVNDSAEIINELNSHISKIIKLKNYAEGMITELEAVSKSIRPPANDSKDETQMLSNETGSTHYGNSQSDGHSRAKDASGTTRLAGGFIIGLSVISGVFLLNRKNNPDEEEEQHEHSYHETFEGNNDYNVQDKEEVIEVCFNDSD
ncbi:reticulocyte binding protein 2e [Plasmodium cynomolgi strain B]|uniref:Reticulocyte binding protein 2e n=1 Tax=Plasmodium cynomolgi (strain B) TaxID=1120755 RepID=K6URA3_PLACD|nr:reticulocyte binding protein 2e [Plasmodium cynomolgi strain B]GAB65599.1 reticulocyte binding protein 2e [Plasmodium cynomolgi strain B]